MPTERETPRLVYSASQSSITSWQPPSPSNRSLPPSPSTPPDCSRCASNLAAAATANRIQWLALNYPDMLKMIDGMIQRMQIRDGVLTARESASNN